MMGNFMVKCKKSVIMKHSVTLMGYLTYSVRVMNHFMKCKKTVIIGDSLTVEGYLRIMSWK